MIVPEREDGKLLFVVCKWTHTPQYMIKTPFPLEGGEGKVRGTIDYIASKQSPIILSFQENGEFSIQLGFHQVTTTTCVVDQVNGIQNLDLETPVVKCTVYYIWDLEEYKINIFYDNKKKVVMNREVQMKVGGESEGIVVKNMKEENIIFL